VVVVVVSLSLHQAAQSSKKFDSLERESVGIFQMIRTETVPHIRQISIGFD
jgi:hypothetical protein